MLLLISIWRREESACPQAAGRDAGGSKLQANRAENSPPRWADRPNPLPGVPLGACGHAGRKPTAAGAVVNFAELTLSGQNRKPRFEPAAACTASTKRFSGRVALTLRSHTPRSHALRGNGSPRRSASQIRTQSVHRLRSDAERRNEKRDLPRFTEMVHKNRLVLADVAGFFFCWPSGDRRDAIHSSGRPV